jgi:hypothetical protein
MRNIKSISYSYGNDSKNPIIYHIHTHEITTSINYRDALEIAYAVVDSLGGSYEFLDELVENFEDERNRGIKIEAV